MIESTSVAGPGFVNIELSNTWMAQVFADFYSLYYGEDLPCICSIFIILQYGIEPFLNFRWNIFINTEYTKHVVKWNWDLGATFTSF